MASRSKTAEEERAERRHAADYPLDDVSPNVGSYLRRRFKAKADDNRQCIADVIRRAVLKHNDRAEGSYGSYVMRLHLAMTRAILAVEEHESKEWRRSRNRMFTSHRTSIRHALDKALEALGGFLDSVNAPDDDAVRVAARNLSSAFEMSEVFTTAYEQRRPKRGTPAEHRQALERDLRELQISAEDRKSIKAALGFTPDPDPT